MWDKYSVQIVIIFIFAILFVVAIESDNNRPDPTPESRAERKNDDRIARHEFCYDGVVYIDYFRNLSVKLLPNGMPATTTKLGVDC